MNTASTDIADVVIIGAGVLGTTLAYHLGRAGLSTIVIEREPFVAAHASGKNAGMIRQLYHHPQLTEWCYRSIRNWPHTARECFNQTGSLILGRRQPNHHCDLFQNVEVSLQSGKVDAVYCASDGLLDSPSYVECIKKLSLEYKVKYRFKTSVKSLLRQNSSWKIELSDGSYISSPWVANCAGAWLNVVFEDFHQGVSIKAKPFARHLFVVDGWESDKMPSSSTELDCGFYWDEANSWYMRNWDTRTRLVSVCDRLPVESPEQFKPSGKATDLLASTLMRVLPEQAAKLSVRNSWHCFRTYCEDLLPIWGQDPELNGLFWLAAFGGFGMSTSYAACQDAADWISKGRGPKYPEFCPSRARLINTDSGLDSGAKKQAAG